MLSPAEKAALRRDEGYFKIRQNVDE